jgi:hypothetical protein
VNNLALVIIFNLEKKNQAQFGLHILKYPTRSNTDSHGGVVFSNSTKLPACTKKGCYQ